MAIHNKYELTTESLSKYLTSYTQIIVFFYVTNPMYMTQVKQIVTSFAKKIRSLSRESIRVQQPRIYFVIYT